MRERVAYRIHVAGGVDPRLADWFDGLVVGHGPAGDAVVQTKPIDQAGLRGVLSALFDLNIPVLSVQAVALDDEATPGVQPARG
jgi:hypothetical protein